MTYAHILSYVASTLWAILPEQIAAPRAYANLTDIINLLAFRATGGEWSADEISARIGAGRERSLSSIMSTRGVAIVPIRGLIAHRMGMMDDSSGGTSAERIGWQLSAVAADATIGTIIYDIDSPGGTVPGIQELAAQMFALRGQKKQIAQVNSLAASAAYWLASQADEIISIPSGQTGSIGVWGAHKQLSAALEKEGITITVFSSGTYKAEGLPFMSLSAEAKAFRQAQVDEAGAQFVADVARGRGVTPAAVRGGYGEGRVLTAPAALQAGLIDRIDTMEATWSRVTGSSSAIVASADDDARRRRRMR